MTDRDSAPFVPRGFSRDKECRECADPMEWGNHQDEVRYRCVASACERAGVIVDENGNTPEEAENWEPPTPSHWTDAWPKGTNLRDQGDGKPYIWADNE